MTTACAWCGAVQEVDLVSLLHFGLSHGVCLSCMPQVFGQQALEAYLKETREQGRRNYEILNKLEREIGINARACSKFAKFAWEDANV